MPSSSFQQSIIKQYISQLSTFISKHSNQQIKCAGCPSISLQSCLPTPKIMEQIKQAVSALQLMDLQDNQAVQNRQDELPGNSNNSSSSRSSNTIQQELNQIHSAQQAGPESPQPQNRLLVSNEQIADNVPTFSLPAIRSQPALMLREEKSKRRKVRAYVQDFSDYLPDSLLIVNKTVIPAIVRKGERYQASIENAPPLKSAYRPMEDWLVWNGSSRPQLQPNEDQLLRFKELLGENRTEEEFIHIRQRLGMNSWKEVLEYIGRTKGELRRIFHVAQRNRQ